jgi:Ribbon-helix-helix protein, copG family
MVLCSRAFSCSLLISLVSHPSNHFIRIPILDFSIFRQGSGHALDFRFLDQRITLSALAKTFGGTVKPICSSFVTLIWTYASHCITMQYKGDTRMERQLTMRLPADLATKLERSAKRLKRKRSEVVREALEQYLDTEPELRPIERVRDLLGSVASGRPDLGQRHREYLTRRLRRGR